MPKRLSFTNKEIPDHLTCMTENLRVWGQLGWLDGNAVKEAVDPHITSECGRLDVVLDANGSVKTYDYLGPIPFDAVLTHPSQLDSPPPRNGSGGEYRANKQSAARRSGSPHSGMQGVNRKPNQPRKDDRPKLRSTRGTRPHSFQPYPSPYSRLLRSRLEDDAGRVESSAASTSSSSSRTSTWAGTHQTSTCSPLIYGSLAPDVPPPYSHRQMSMDGTYMPLTQKYRPAAMPSTEFGAARTASSSGVNYHMGGPMNNGYHYNALHLTFSDHVPVLADGNASATYPEMGQTHHAYSPIITVGSPFEDVVSRPSYYEAGDIYNIPSSQYLQQWSGLDEYPTTHTNKPVPSWNPHP